MSQSPNKGHRKDVVGDGRSGAADFAIKRGAFTGTFALKCVSKKASSISVSILLPALLHCQHSTQDINIDLSKSVDGFLK